MIDVNTITLKQVLDRLDAGETCTLGVRSCDLKKNDGGEFIVFENCRKHMHLTREEFKNKIKQSHQKVYKNPNHYENSTRNIMLESGEIRKIHIRLIRRFNNQTVL